LNLESDLELSMLATHVVKTHLSRSLDPTVKGLFSAIASPEADGRR